MGCPCSSGKKSKKGQKAPDKTALRLIPMAYQGDRTYEFEVVSGVTRERYCVPVAKPRLVCLVRSRQPGVQPGDVAWFRSVNHGTDYVLYSEPEPESKPKLEPVEDPA